jgi:phage-related protein
MRTVHYDEQTPATPKRETEVALQRMSEALDG